MKTILIAAMLAAAPATAFAQAAPQPASTAPVPVDPARLAAARSAAAKLWPVGTYKRMMSGTMDRMMDAVMSSMMGMKIGDIAGPMVGKEDGEAVKDAMGDATLGEMTKAADPHFAERTKITSRVMFESMGDLMAKFEPKVQGAVAHGLARRFTVAELGELDRFFATPVGARYAADAMLLAVEPEMIGAMTKFVPEMLKALPDIMKKVEAATAHLPPPPKPRNESDDEEIVEPTSSTS